MDIAAIHHALDTAVNTVSLLLNGYLLYLVKNYSTFRVTVYRVLLATDAGLDFALAAMILLAQPVRLIVLSRAEYNDVDQVFLTAEGHFVVICNGFLSQRCLFLDSVIPVITGVIIHINVLWIPVQFAYRYAFLCLQNERQDQQSAPASGETRCFSRKRLNRLIAAGAIGWNFVALCVILAMFWPSASFQPQGLRVLELNQWPTGNMTAANSAIFGAHLVR